MLQNIITQIDGRIVKNTTEINILKVIFIDLHYYTTIMSKLINNTIKYILVIICVLFNINFVFSMQLKVDSLNCDYIIHFLFVLLAPVSGSHL